MHIKIMALAQVHRGKVLKLSVGAKAIPALQWEFTAGIRLSFKEQHLIPVKQVL